jgi:hypothetical protein
LHRVDPIKYDIPFTEFFHDWNSYLYIEITK